MRRLTLPLLAAAYCAAALGLLAQSVYAARRGDTSATVQLGGAAMLFGLAIAHQGHQRDVLRTTRVHLERYARPTPAPTTAARPANPGCCTAWWATAGAEHDPTTCTRKDHHA